MMPEIQVHEHGEHDCYCPDCGYTITVEAGQKCNQLDCPDCGARLRAKETGEYRGIY
jgi:DNA-directed RNA polymerase subunit RPC12/RpoP